LIYFKINSQKVTEGYQDIIVNVVVFILTFSIFIEFINFKKEYNDKE